MEKTNEYSPIKFQYTTFKSFGLKGYPLSEADLRLGKKNIKITIEDIFAYLFLDDKYGHKVEINYFKNNYLKEKRKSNIKKMAKK